MDPQDLGEEDGANVDLDSQRKGKCAVIKTSTRQVTKMLSVNFRVRQMSNANLMIFITDILLACYRPC